MNEPTTKPKIIHPDHDINFLSYKIDELEKKVVEEKEHFKSCLSNLHNKIDKNTTDLQTQNKESSDKIVKLIIEVQKNSVKQGMYEKVASAVPGMVAIIIAIVTLFLTL